MGTEVIVKAQGDITVTFLMPNTYDQHEVNPPISMRDGESRSFYLHKNMDIAIHQVREPVELPPEAQPLPEPEEPEDPNAAEEAERLAALAAAEKVEDQK